MSEPEKPEAPTPTQRRFWSKKRWWILALILGGLVWLNGPGWRWIAQKAAARYLPAAGLEGSFELEGSLASGEIGVRKLQLAGDTVVTLAGLDRADIQYNLSDIFKGEVESIEVHGLHADIDLAAAKNEEDPTKPKTDPIALLKSLHSRLSPMEIHLTDISANVHRGEEPVVTVSPTSLHHTALDPVFDLSLGAIELPNEVALSAQTVQLSWEETSLSLDRLDLMEGVGIRDLLVSYPGEKFSEIAGKIVMEDSILDITSDLNLATLTLAGEPLSLDATLGKFGLDLPLSGEISALRLDVAGLSAGLPGMDAELSLQSQNVVYDEWPTGDLELKASLVDHQLDANLRGTAVSSPVSIDLDGTLDPEAPLQPLRAGVRLRIDQLESVLTYVQDRYLPENEAAPPPSSLSGVGEVTFTQGRLETSKVILDATARDASPPLHLEAAWAPDSPLEADLTSPGLEITGSYDFEPKNYDATVATTSWNPEILAPWLAPFGVGMPEGMTGSLNLAGSGSIASNTHRGELDLKSFTWARDTEAQPLKVFAEATYDWPKEVDVSSLNVQQGVQKIETTARLSDGRFLLKGLSWTDGSDILLTGQASIPVGENPADWKAILRSTEPVDLQITSAELPFSKLHPYLPETVRFQEDSSGQIKIDLTGSPSAPELDADFRASRLKLQSYSDAPPIEIDLQATGRENSLKLEGEIRAPDYPPAVIDGLTRWAPEQWAEDPQTVKEAPLDASLVIENFNLNLFAGLVPKARALEGQINLKSEVTGTIGDPQPVATLTLEGGRFETSDPSIPRVKDAGLRLTATPTRLELETLSATISGGELKGSGSADIIEGELKNLNIGLQGVALPAVRNESMIVRFNTDLSLRGDWENATLSGSIGVIDSLFHKDVEILPLGGPVRTVAEPELPSIDSQTPAEAADSIAQPFHDWRLDLTAKSVNPFLVRGNLAGGEAYLDARIDGTIGAPRPSGQVTLREVTAKLPFSTLNIKSGRIVLRPDHPFDPELDLKGHSSIRPYEVDIYVYGPLSDPQIQPTSNPPLPENEIFTLLASGTTTEGIEDTNAATARAAQLLIEEVRRGRLGNLRGLKPLFQVLDRVDFQVGEKDPYSSRKYNSVAFELDDNWLLTTGISEQGNSRTKITYLLRFR